ncbi:lipo-releasing system ATP-binding protein LolD, partial [Vibrio parahaemolyticus AQ3810]|jgi:hypothetical protein
VWW